MTASPLTAERVRELFDYFPDTGDLRRKRPRQKQGERLNGGGYLTYWVDGRSHRVHRLIWLHVTGGWPKQEIDHRNGDRADNRWTNLRDVSRAVNSQNRHKTRSSSGFLGVKRSRNSTFLAVIVTHGKKFQVGSFQTAELAHAAYVQAKRQLHEGNTL